MTADSRSDEALIAGMAGGDRDAFAALYRRRRGDVYRFALHVSGSASVADDVTQDVFMALIHHAGRYQPGRSTVVAWLLGITRNQVRRSAARHRPTLSLSDDDAQKAVEPMNPSDPFASVARREHLDVLRRALLALPVRYREAVVLCDLQELSYVEAAAALGCAVGTVRSRLHRGRTLLARRLRGEEGSIGVPAARWLL